MAPKSLQSKPRRIIRLPQVLDRIGGGKSRFLQDVKEGRAPRPVPLGLRAVGWVEDEIDAMIDARVAERDAAGGAWRPLADAATRVVSKLGAKP
jgi:prophage regulatory protein